MCRLANRVKTGMNIRVRVSSSCATDTPPPPPSSRRRRSRLLLFLLVLNFLCERLRLFVVAVHSDCPHRQLPQRDRITPT